MGANAEKNGESIQSHRPRFFTYDDKPSFNLISGLMQAREDIWQKNSIIELQTAMKQLNGNYNPSTPGSVATIAELASEMKKFKERSDSQKTSIKALENRVKNLEEIKPPTPQNISENLSQNREFKELKTTVERLERNIPSTPQLERNPSFKELKTAVQKLEQNSVPEDVSRKITELQSSVQLLTPDNVRTKSSIIETLFKEIHTLKREKQNKRGVALRQLSESRLIQGSC